MFQFRRFPTYDYFIHHRLLDLLSSGFPHSDIHGSMAAFASPWLFADCCVLRRLLVPRHSPCALCSLTISLRYLWFFGYIILDDNICSFLYYPNKYYLSLFFVQFSRCIFDFVEVWIFFATPRTKVRKEQKNSKFSKSGGLKWTRTTDLTLIRRAL